MTEDDDTGQFLELYGDLGTIKVQVEREMVLGTTPLRRSEKPSSPRSLQPVPEKGLKGRPLHVASTYRQPRPSDEWC